MAQRDGESPADDVDPPLDGATTPPAASSRGDDTFPNDAFIDSDGDAPAEVALQACPFCRRMTRADADLCHRCGNFLLHDHEASPRRRDRIIRWVVAMSLFVFAAWVLYVSQMWH